MPWEGRIRWRLVTADRTGEFVANGHRERNVFPHRALFLPRPGPDGSKLARWMCDQTDPSTMWEVVLHADHSMLEEFPSELFFDSDILWHQQHLGRPGHIAYADVVIAGTEMWSMSHVSDLVQRISRRREHKTRIENRFKGWHDMLLNALLAFAVERGARRLHIPTSELQMKNTDPNRQVQPELFERLYDRSVNRLFGATQAGGWWVVDVAANRDRLVAPAVHEEEIALGSTICLCHDVEAGLGHEGIDQHLAERANRSWRESVTAMLRCEREAGLRATYNVVGRLLAEVRLEIEADGHCVAFHSYDHRVDRRSRAPRSPHRFLEGPRGASVAGLAGGLDQVSACRRIDYRIKGYRVPRSRITPELTDDNLLFHNFEWLASSTASLGVSRAELRNGIVRVPVHLDDFGLYRKRLDYEAWTTKLRETVAAHDIPAVSLHDCYAHLWLDGYPQLLEQLGGLGEFRTLDDVAAAVTLASAV